MKKKQSKKKNSNQKKSNSWRQIAGVWENEGADGVFYSVNVNNNSTYSPGKLVWIDEQTGGTYLVKSLNVYDVDPSLSEKRLPIQNLSINLENEYHVEALATKAKKSAPKVIEEEDDEDLDSMLDNFDEDDID